MRKKSEGRLVYSTNPALSKPEAALEEEAPVGTGPARVYPAKKGRGGKTVTVVTDLPMTAADLKKFARQIRKSCGLGGTVKDGTIELQGDHVDAVIAAIEKQGLKARRSGG